ncbi:hypothetical protein AVEN_205118-1 [Araneus ventricosus]|uniref:Uncharacterized protein n=1 Tax=Araneus ventricosus TaxID=182803 RepID=A0A4Y2GCT9_ARAVE|nr:hypothetical protein AVEN_205118-1 [Araneus ventricosus]
MLKKTKKDSIEDIKNMLHVYRNVSKIVNVIDDNYSFPAFFIVLQSLIGLFWIGYSLAFATDLAINQMLALWVYGSGQLSNLLLILVSSSITNEEAKRTKKIIEMLPFRIPKHHEELKFKIKNECSAEFNLTFWKITILDRSFICTCSGSLLSYGILIATLGK